MLIRRAHSNRSSTPAAQLRSLQLRGLHFGFLRDGDVGVGVHPEGAKDPKYREGRKAFGFRPGEPETISRVMELHDSGLKLPAITRILNAEGRKTRNGGQWFPNQASNIIKRAKV